MKKEINILFTSAGRRVELLRSFRNAYIQLGLKGNIIAVDIDPLAPALQVADRSYLVPRIALKDFIQKLAKIITLERADVIFPLTDHDIPILAANRNMLETTGVRAVVVSQDVAKMTSDKWFTYQFFQSLEVTTPLSWKIKEVSDGDFKFPVYIKPRFGSASKKTFKVCNGRELSFFLNYVPNPIVQEYLPGPEITNDIICDFKGNVMAVVSRQRIEVRSGEVAKGITIYDSTIIDTCVRIAKELQAIGPITVQCIKKDGVPYFTEINARFGGGVPLGIAAGVNSPRLLLAKATGLEIEIPPLGSYQVGLSMTRFDDSFFSSEEDIEKMESHRF